MSKNKYKLKYVSQNKLIKLCAIFKYFAFYHFFDSTIYNLKRALCCAFEKSGLLNSPAIMPVVVISRELYNVCECFNSLQPRFAQISSCSYMFIFKKQVREAIK